MIFFSVSRGTSLEGRKVLCVNLVSENPLGSQEGKVVRAVMLNVSWLSPLVNIHWVPREKELEGKKSIEQKRCTSILVLLKWGSVIPVF